MIGATHVRSRRVSIFARGREAANLVFVFFTLILQHGISVPETHANVASQSRLANFCSRRDGATSLATAHCRLRAKADHGRARVPDASDGPSIVPLIILALALASRRTNGCAVC